MRYYINLVCTFKMYLTFPHSLTAAFCIFKILLHSVKKQNQMHLCVQKPVEKQTQSTDLWTQWGKERVEELGEQYGSHCHM